ncbi:aldo/keto reductase [Microbacteriaceae bacterium VKM Ac-2854]|nr:aldo/keto reductase [Microbacteriaceae bacterium VKM Ac-2854]
MTDSSSRTAVATAPLTLGDGLVVTGQGYGAMSLSDVYGPIDDAQALATLTHAVDSGIRFIDTANVYGNGRSESTISKLLATRRDEVILATKFGIENGGGIGKRTIRGDRAYVHQKVDESLARLGTDHIDLYYQHRPDPKVPIEETVGAMAELVAAGKVRHLGLSEATGAEIRRAHAVHPIAAVQSEWSIVTRDVENHVIPALVELGIGFVPYSPLSRALLSDQFSPADIGASDGRPNFPRFSPENLPANLELVAELRTLAASLEISTAQLALAWVHRMAERLGLASSPIPGTRFAERVTENAAAADIELDEATLATLDGYAARVHGPRSFDLNWVSAGRE